MIKAFKISFSIIFFGFKLPFVLWLNSKQKLSSYKYKDHEDMLDNEYLVTSWLDWFIDCIIYFTYPFGLMFIIILLISTKTMPVLIGIIPIYFSPLFISFMRELGGSLMLLHMNVRGIKKNTNKQ